MTSRDMKDKSIYKIPFIGWFFHLIKRRLFKLFVSDVQHPEHASLHLKCERNVTESHNFAMLILKADSFFSKNKLKNASVDVMLDILLFAIKGPETPTECKSDSVSYGRFQ